jgi:predicted transcriptional regulator
MSDTTYTIKIKKEYASAIIEDLKQIDAIEIMEEPVPEWQKEESLKRLSEMKANPSVALSEEDFFEALETKMDERV